MVRLGWIVGCAALVVGCAHAPRQTKFMESLPGVTMSTDELRARVFELGRRESAAVEEAVGDAYNGTDDPQIRRAAITWGLKMIPDVQVATVHDDPMVALGDLWGLALQTEILAGEGPGRQRFGATFVFVARAGRQMAQESEEVATLAFGAARVPQVRAEVERWARANPITPTTFARPTARVAWARALGGRDRSALGFIASADDRLTLLSARLEMMNETLLDRVRWTSEMIIRDSLGVDSVDVFLDRARALVDQEHARLIQDVSDQRDQLFAQVDHQRRAAFGDIARERADIFEHVAGEREAIVGQADALLQKVNADTRALINRTLLWVGIGAAFLIVLAAIALWIVWHSMRRPRGPERRERRRAPTAEPLTVPGG